MSKKNKKISALQVEIQEQQMALDAVMRRVLIVEATLLEDKFGERQPSFFEKVELCESNIGVAFSGFHPDYRK